MPSPEEAAETYRKLQEAKTTSPFARRSAIFKIMTSPDALKAERAEKLRGLTFEQFIPSVDVPQDEAMKPLETLYCGNLIPDEAFIALAGGRVSDYQEILKKNGGGMWNRWRPTQREREILERSEKPYISVADQTYGDLMKRSPIPCDYRVYVLRDQQGVVRASSSFRLPPKDPASLELYRNHLDGIFSHQSVHLEDRWPNRIKKQMPRIMEWDTVNVDPAYHGAGTIVFAQAMAEMEQELGSDLPEMIYHFRFHGTRVSEIDPGPGTPLSLPIVSEDDELYEIGSNMPSERYTAELGSVDFGYRMNDKEPVVRELPDGTVIVNSHKWRYSSGLWRKVMRDCTKKKLVDLGFKPGEMLE